MQTILDRAKRFRLADINAINNADFRLAQFHTYQRLLEQKVPFIACDSMDASSLTAFINCYNTGSELFSSNTVSTMLPNGICTQNAVFLGVPEANENEEKEKEIIETVKSTDCIVFLSSMAVSDLSPKETYALKLLSKAIEQYPHMTEKIIFILHCDYANSITDEKSEKRQNDIISLLNTNKIKFFTFVSTLGLEGKKHSNQNATEQSGILKIREYISGMATDVVGAHIRVLQDKRKTAKNAVNELLLQVSKQHNIINTVITMGDDIQLSIKNTLDKCKNRIQESLHNELSVFESVPQTPAIALNFKVSVTEGFKSEKAARESIKNELDSLYSTLPETVHSFVTKACACFRETLKYANPDYHCFEHINHVTAHIISDCIDELQNYHIMLSKTRFSAPLKFAQEKEFLEHVGHFERDMRDYIIPNSAKTSLDSYLSILRISKVTDGQGILGIKKYTYVIENADEVIAAIENDLNTNFNGNKEVVWRSIQFIEQKFLNTFRESINKRISDMENDALHTYSHPQAFKDLKHDRDIASTVLKDIQKVMTTI